MTSTASTRGARAHGAAVALTALVLISGPQVGHAEALCPHAASLSGEDTLVLQVGELLAARDISPQPDQACAAVSASLHFEGEGIHISITDAEGHTIVRFADDVNGAATLIESWARSDVAAPLLAARVGPVRSASQSSDHESPRVVEQVAVRGARRVDVVGAVEAIASSDRAVWTAVRAGGCVLVRDRVCLGAFVRLARDTKRQGESVELGTSRTAIDMMLTADLPLQFGPVMLSPGIAIGQTSVRAKKPVGGIEVAYDAAGLKLAAGVGASYPLGGAWSLRGDLGASYSPDSRTVLTEQDPEGIDPDELRLAGAPRTHVFIGLGLVYGGL